MGQLVIAILIGMVWRAIGVPQDAIAGTNFAVSCALESSYLECD